MIINFWLDSFNSFLCIYLLYSFYIINRNQGFIENTHVLYSLYVDSNIICICQNLK